MNLEKKKNLQENSSLRSSYLLCCIGKEFSTAPAVILSYAVKKGQCKIKNSQDLGSLILGIVLLMIFGSTGNLYADLTDYATSHSFILPESSQRISMDFKGAILEDVLKIFSQQSGLNFIAASDIANKSITVYLEDVPVEEALERILKAYNLTYEMEPGSDIFIIQELDVPERETETRIYPLKYATVPSSKIHSTIKIGDEGTGTAPATAGIITAIQNALSSFGNLVEDARTNSLIITDIPSQFPRIEKAIAQLDVPIPQILIEVEMLDVSKSSADKLGVKWGDTPLQFRGAKRQDVIPWDRDSNYFIKRLPEFFGSTEFTSAVVDFSGLAYALQFLKTQTDTRNLARPRILTLNNETAEIKISTDEAIGQSTTTGGGGTESLVTQSVEAERVQTGVFLVVTPQANVETREIKLAIAPRVIEARKGQTFGNATFFDPEERGSQSIMQIRDGETVIIGGLLRSDFTNTKTKVPVVGDVPIVGSIFRHKDQSEKSRELMIFISPHIIDTYATANAPQPGPKRLFREQDVPLDRQDEIEKALSVFGE